MLDVASDFPLWSVSKDSEKKFLFSLNLRQETPTESLSTLRSLSGLLKISKQQLLFVDVKKERFYQYQSPKPHPIFFLKMHF